MKWRRIAGLGTLAVAAVAAGALVLRQSPETRETPIPHSRQESLESDADSSKRPSVVLIVIDTLRLDHTNLGGYPRPTTPGLERLAALGLTSERHFANAPWTKPSVATMLTGLLPGAHGAQWGKKEMSDVRNVDVLSEGFETLPESLQRHGYRTFAFMTNTTLTSSLGFAQGFEAYQMLDPTLQGDVEAVQETRRILTRAEGPVFVWCHLMAVHNYNSPRKFFSTGQFTRITNGAPLGPELVRLYRQNSREEAIDSYDSAVVFADGLVTELVDFIRARRPNTLIIITSDHGEEFLEHRGYLHGRTLYNEMLRVPLLILGPKIPKGQTITRLTSHADLFATVLEYLGLPPAVDGRGESLLGEQRGESAPVYAEKRSGRYAIRALIGESGKFIESKPAVLDGSKPPMQGEGIWEFYRDPTGAEQLNSAPELEARSIERTRRHFAQISAENDETLRARAGSLDVQRPMTQEELDALRALGYAE